MNRTIKFRAWNKKQDKWDYYTPSNFAMYQKQLSEDLLEGIFEQFTGLKDKNGVEIYEGDLLEFEERGRTLTSVVEWDQKLSGWSPLNEFTTNGVNTCNDEYFPIETCRVIGNIHQNYE